MKTVVFCLGLILCSSSLMAQDWQTDIEEAKELAAESDRPIVLVFQGSDWCAPCIKLDHEVFSTEAFQEYAEEHFVMLKADFPRKKKNALSEEQQQKNNMLAEKYNQDGYFPLVVILDKEGHVLGKAGYENMTPSEYIALLESSMVH